MAIGVLALRGLIGREPAAAVCARVGLSGFAWLGFVLGQGILGVVWLGLSLVGLLHASLVGVVVALGWLVGFLTILTFKPQVPQTLRLIRADVLSCWGSRSWYFWVGVGVISVILLRAVIALLPTSNDDALWFYLTVAKVIGATHTLTFQPFSLPHGALYPLQVEMHWAALFALANETAVTLWDYLCALSFLGGMGLIGWSFTSSRRVALLVALMMLSTPGFHNLMGSGKVDNATAQYGAAAFLALVLYPVLGRRSMILAGLYGGWALAGRYTNVILVPALAIAAVIVIYRSGKTSRILWVTNALVGAVAVAFSVGPMLFKNWLLVGCPLAPFECRDTFWATTVYLSSRHNISGGDLLLYPFLWTFARRPDMLGNISPFFIGFFPFLLAYRHLPQVRRSMLAGLAGLVSTMTWLLIQPHVLFTRFLVVPLGLLAIPLSASAVAAEHDSRQRIVRWLVRTSILLILGFLFFQGRAVVHAVRYLASIDTRAARYESVPGFGYDVASWLNTHAPQGQRVALKGFGGRYYFVSPHHLLSSESTDELQWLWTHCRCRFPPSWTADFWHFYARNGFAYVVVPKQSAEEAVSVWPDDLGQKRPTVAFVGRDSVVLRLENR